MSNIFSQRIPSLDGLRAISIFLVIASHFSYTIGFPDVYNVGNLGVRVFFVISGFLITGLLIKELDQTDQINLAKFYFRRTLRIFPPYYFYLTVILLCSIFGLMTIPLAKFIPAYTYTSNYLELGIWNLGHTWSLAIEEQFYLIFPGLLLLFGRRKAVWILLAVLFISPIIRIIDFQLFHEQDPIWIYKGFHSNVDTLAIGCLLALQYQYLHSRRWYLQILNSKLMIFAPFLAIVASAQVDHPKLYLGFSFTVCNVLIALCIDWAVTHYQNNPVGNILNSSPFVWAGMLSYSIYLWQQPFFNYDEPAWFTLFPYNFIGIGVCSIFSYYIVEKTSLQLRQKWETTLFGRDSEPEQKTKGISLKIEPKKAEILP
jgi:peptidoglycan/LPS O-acetylase OafA/YrhL